MSEALPSFVTRRKPDWDALGRLLESQRRGTLTLDELRSLDGLYRKAAGDLARAQAFYPGTDAHRFLNQLCARAYAAIYRTPVDRAGAIRRFFALDFPRTVRAELPHVLASAALFVLGIVAGALVVYLEPASGMRLIPTTVREAVESRELWTDSLLSMAPPGMISAAIATNNLAVTILTFASGLLAGLGTTALLLFNGVHLGAISAYCLRAGMGGDLLGFIGAHGPVELSIIVLAGAAGLILGRALLDPGELPRGQHLRRRSVEAVKIVVGCAPFLALIGIVEGYVSPGDLFSRPLKLGLGLALGVAFWAYLLLTGRTQTPRDRPAHPPR